MWVDNKWSKKRLAYHIPIKNFLTKDNNILKDAKLKFKKNKTLIKCKDCNEISEIEDFFIVECSKCSSRKIKVINNDEIKIISVET